MSHRTCEVAAPEHDGSAARRLALLYRVTAALIDRPLDAGPQLGDVARLLVEELAEWCVIDLLLDGKLERVAAAHRDPAREPLCRLLTERYPIRSSAHPAVRVLESGRPLLLQRLTEQLLGDVTGDERHREVVRMLGTGSMLVVPLRAHGGVLGTLCLCAGERGPAYDDRDLSAAGELATRISTAIEHGRAYQAARDALAERDLVLATVSHDLANPIAAVRLSAQTLLSVLPAGEETARAMAARIARAAVHAESLIGDLLSLARLRDDTRELREVRAAELCHETAQLCEAQARERGMRLELEVDPAAAALPLRCDPDRVVEALGNLVANAIKFGRSVVRLAAHAHDHEVIFTVADDGPGIELDERPHVFERFWQGRATQAMGHALGHGGAGLGLFITRRIAEQHGGRVWLDSDGSGATFHLALPACV